MIIITEQMAERGGICPVCGKWFRSNGIGPSDIPQLTTVLDKLPSSALLRYGARFHDWFFHLADKWGTQEDADRIMYELNEKQISLKCSWWNAWYYRIMNKRNYVFVRKFGHNFWGKDGCGL